VGVRLREDVDEVIIVLKQIDPDLRGEPEVRKDNLGAARDPGPGKFADSAVIIKALIKTKPICQWAVGREFNRPHEEDFDERGSRSRSLT
jgi:small conductance mechanosensitive channel